MSVSQAETQTVSRATTLHPFYCTTQHCEMQRRPLGWAEPGRARLYCGKCRRWNDYLPATLTS